jgi:hypothetical protein
VDGSAHYLAARIAAVRGDRVAAARELQKALRQGFSPPGDGLLGPHNETDFLRSGAEAPLRSLVSDMNSGD